MTHLPRVLHSCGRLLSYPDDQTAETAELLYVLLMEEIPAAAGEVSEFGQFLEHIAQHYQSGGARLNEVEETFTWTFDINPKCALEVGWHLFGEEYARGMFLVRMREELRKFEIPESVELPDHISHVLAVLAAMPCDEAERFCRACVQPAVEKMNHALSDRPTPYRHVVASLAMVLRHVWGDNEASRVAASGLTRSDGQPFAGDLLRSFPVADVDCASSCGASCGEPTQIVSLDQLLATVPQDQTERNFRHE